MNKKLKILSTADLYLFLVPVTVMHIITSVKILQIIRDDFDSSAINSTIQYKTKPEKTRGKIYYSRELII